MPDQGEGPRGGAEKERRVSLCRAGWQGRLEHALTNTATLV